MRLKNYFLLTCFILPSFTLNAQLRSLTRCYTDELSVFAKNEFPELARLAELREIAYQEAMSNNYESRALENGCDIYVIPTVVHIIFNDEVSNISDEQIHSQIAVLNQDYRKVTGSPADGDGADMKIQFCLATKDPGGNATNGITRTESERAMHNSSDDRELKELIRWDTERYLNIWVVKEISSGSNTTLGYTYIPGTVPRVRDGVVITSKHIGTTGTATPPYNQGRTLTHEIGHFLGLHHTFRSEGNCSDNSAANCMTSGDRVCDTPAEEEAKYFCPEETNSCIEFPCDLPDPISNFLNYVDDVCMDQFTAGQKSRAHFFLDSYRSRLVSEENLISTGCTNVSIRKTIPEVHFSSEGVSTCSGNTIQFFDASIGCVEHWAWEFPGGSPSTSTEPNPVVSYTTPGWYDVKLRVSNDSASSDTSMNRYIFIPEATEERGFANNFEMGTVIPAGWQVVDDDGKGTWLLTTLGASDGLGSALMRNFQLNSRCTTDDLISTTIDLSKTDQAQLSFDYAYQLRTDDPVPGDRLKVDLSTDCGRTYSTILFDKSGADLATVSGTSSEEPFVPNSFLDWKTEIINLRSFAGRKNVRIRFRNYGQGGQQLYLDRIELSGTLDVKEDIESSLRIIPNPFADRLEIGLSLKQSQKLNFSLIDLSGKQLTPDYAYHLSVGQHKLVLKESEISNLSKGIYLLQIRGEGFRLYEKLIKF